mmetsp:Transcript_28633/g.61676  ORF Transcript_28633/g.61676 Transcript_28633/m.61676 type:complete len:321 (-) Transcript_28633:92-1054(-)
MNKFVICALTAMALTVDAATRVAVIELGASGTVRRTTTASQFEETSVDGVASFWSALHGYSRKLQHAGMPVVPDLFSRPDSGIVVGLTGSGIDLDHMPTLNDLLKNVDEQEDNRVVGHMQVSGNQCKKMLNNVQNKQDYASSGSLKSAFESQAQEAGISGMHFDVSSANAADIDGQLASFLKEYSADHSLIIHLVVEEEDGSARRRSLARQLDGEKQNGARGATTTQRRLEQEGEGEEADGDGENKNNNNGYYGYGYYNAYGEWVTPYKTMFQIQYFNVVLWTSLGLVAVLFFSIYLMIYMPLMADTLLFGESARVAHDD